MTNTNTNTTAGQVKAYAQSHDVEFDAQRQGREWSVECYAPEGKLWRNHGTHFLALPDDGFYGTPNWSETMDVLREEVESGFEDCTDTDCDACNQ